MENFWGKKLSRISRFCGYSLCEIWELSVHLRHKWPIRVSFLRENCTFHQFVNVFFFKVFQCTVAAYNVTLNCKHSHSFPSFTLNLRVHTQTALSFGWLQSGLRKVELKAVCTAIKLFGSCIIQQTTRLQKSAWLRGIQTVGPINLHGCCVG